MSSEVPIAVVDDDEDLRASTVQLLSLAGYAVDDYPDAAGAMRGIAPDFPGIVLTDIRMPGMSGIELFRTLHARDPELPVILITGHGDIGTAVDTLKAGAWDFLTKPCDPETLLSAVARAAAARKLVMENRRLRALVEEAGADELIGRSASMRRLRASVPVIGGVDLDVVVEGATGTGKQLLARLIHRSGRRGRHRFVVFDCAATPTAAGRDPFDAHGLVSRADRGTLFLDNLDRADPALQHRLIRFAEHRVVALDARDPQPIDTRIIAAIDEGSQGRLLPQLYHRLAAVSLRIPPLDERPDDVPLLVGHFAGVLAKTHRRPVPSSTDTAILMTRRNWTGNVRELEMAVERLVLGLDEGPCGAEGTHPLPERVRAFERAAIIEAITAADGDVALAIQHLRIPRETFYYRVKRLGISLDGIRQSLIARSK